MNHQAASRRGIALVVVLVFLLLLSVFIVGFFSNSQDELSAAQSFTGEVSAHQLAESAVAVVMGQIREATTRENGAWGSQPGMIRVYRSGKTASDKADAFFKLYSSDDMILSGSEIGSWDPTTEIPEGANGWKNQPAFWTNLNERALSADGAFRYPILDPSLDRKVEGLEFISRVGENVDTEDDLKARMPVRWLYVLRDGTLTVPSQISDDGLEASWQTSDRAPTSSNPIVGRIAFWTDDETSKVNVNTAGGYSLKEVDPATAGANRAKDPTGVPYTEDNYPGAFWDAPRAYTRFDRGDIMAQGTNTNPDGDERMKYSSLALSQPVRGEFQRYPGHPSTTSLGILFRNISTTSGQSMQDAQYSLTSGQLALLAPRLQYSPDPSAKSERGSNYGTDRLLAAFDSPPSLRVKRLYASVDELFYAQPDPSANPLADRKQTEFDLGVTAANDRWSTQSPLSPTNLEKMRFFLTAYSRAPEMNLWGRPRMTLWPVTQVTTQSDEGAYWNASDRLLAFCSTIGPDASNAGGEAKVTRFIFQRGRTGWISPTADASIARNLTLYNYLRALTNQAFPGFGGKSFKEKYETLGEKFDRDQILTEMFDYIRVVNLRDSTRDKTILPNLKTSTNPTGVSPTKAQYQTIESYRYAPRGLVVPLQFNVDGNKTRGFGRFPTISEVAIVLYHAGYKGADKKRYFLKEEMLDDAGNEKTAITHNLVRAFMVIETFNPMHGFAPITSVNDNSIDLNRKPIVIELEGLDQFQLNGQSLAMPAKASTGFIHASNSFWHGRHTGGSEGFFHVLYRSLPSGWNNRDTGLSLDKRIPIENDHPSAMLPWRGTAFQDSGGYWYPFQSMADAPSMGDGDTEAANMRHPGIAIPVENATASLSGASITVAIKMNNQEIRRLSLNYPATNVPVPQGGKTKLGWDDDGTSVTTGSATSKGSPITQDGSVWQNDNGGFGKIPGSAPLLGPSDPNAAINKSPFLPAGPYKSHRAFVKSFAGRMAWIQNADSNNYYNLDTKPDGINWGERWRQVLQPGDVIRSVVFSKGDLRSSCLQDQVQGASSVFEPHPDYTSPFKDGDQTRPRYRAHSLRAGNGTVYFNDTFFGNITNLISGKSYQPSVAADLPMTSDGTTGTRPYNQTAVRRSKDNQPGDFDTGLGNLADGPFCNKADEGNLTFRRQITDAAGKFLYWQYMFPYFDWTFEETFDTFFTPNRQVPSAVLFGSLLAGKNQHWQTLCFSPNPAGDNHPGRTGPYPKDYLWLDLFNMPVVEPYAISEPFSTAGKINMNYQIVPFSNIKRSSGMRAALQPVRVTAYPATASNLYNSSNQLILKLGNGGLITTPYKNDYRYLVDRDETLKAFDYFFDQFKSNQDSGFFKSAAQICDMYLYPRQNHQAMVAWSPDESEIKLWWQQNSLTGDNVREKPYADLYPRLTTKSNTYCVHIRAQALRQSAPTNSASASSHYRTWNEKRDRVIGEYRGSSIIERYIDPLDERFKAGSTDKINVDNQSLDVAYRFRVLNTKRFDP